MHVAIFNTKIIMSYFLGDVNDDLNFSYKSDVSLLRGCAVTFQGQFWYFGGSLSEDKRQVNLSANI